MVNIPTIRGELQHDIEMLQREIRRASGIFNDLKRRGTELKANALNDQKSLDAAAKSLGQKKISLPAFKEDVKTRLSNLEQGLKREMIEDEIFVKEIERVKSILEQVRKRFGFGENLTHIAYAAASITMAEVYIKSRVQVCTQFIKESLDPLSRNISSLGFLNLAQQTSLAYRRAYEATEQFNEATRKAMIEVLKAYKTLYQKYPLLMKVLERSYAGTQKRRVFE